MPDAWHRTVSWITEGMEGEIIGDRGLAYNAAAGVELDRYDLSLGTPPHTKIIASSGGHSDNYVLVTEELLYAYAGLMGSIDYRIRADMTFFTASNDGAVFSTGSIAFGQALPANGFDNSASRLLVPSASSIHCAGRKTTSSGTTPSLTSRQRTIRSSGANATIMILRVPPAFMVRARNHCAKALFFWNLSNRRAN